MNDDRQIVSELWHNFHFLFQSNSQITRLMFTKFLHDVKALAPLLMRALIMRYCIPFRNARAKGEGGHFLRLPKAPKLIGYHSNVPWGTTKLMTVLQLPYICLPMLEIW